MSVGGIADNAVNVITKGVKRSARKKVPYADLERYKTQIKLDNLKIELDSLEKEESLIARPNDGALKEIEQKITACLKKIASVKKYLASIPELYTPKN